MSIMVTGAYGFIAARVAQTLLAKGQTDLILVDNPEFAKTRGCVNGLENLPFIDREKLFEELVKLNNITAVIHLGACTDTGNHDEGYMWKMNTDYTKKLWQWCAEKKIPLIYASSGATYGRGEEGYSDDHAAIPHYKPLNVYGMDENHKGRMASPIFHGFHQIATTSKMSLFRSHKEGIKDGEQMRDFIFVDDIVKLVLFFLEKNPPSGIYNCGTGHARTFVDLAKALFKAIGKEVNIEWMDTPEKFRKGYQYFTQADMTKAREAGYNEPFLSIEEGVDQYVKWLKSHP